MFNSRILCGQPKTQDTNIDQSILDDLFSMEHAPRTQLPLDEISEEWNNLFEQGVLTINDFDEEVAEESDLSIVHNECTDLPDLPEYENMIDWGANSDSGDPSAVKTRLKYLMSREPRGDV